MVSIPEPVQKAVSSLIWRTVVNIMFGPKLQLAYDAITWPRCLEYVLAQQSDKPSIWSPPVTAAIISPDSTSNARCVRVHLSTSGLLAAQRTEVFVERIRYAGRIVENEKSRLQWTDLDNFEPRQFNRGDTAYVDVCAVSRQADRLQVLSEKGVKGYTLKEPGKYLFDIIVRSAEASHGVQLEVDWRKEHWDDLNVVQCAKPKNDRSRQTGGSVRWLLAACLFVLIILGGYLGIRRLDERARFRREVAPLIRVDLVELGEFIAFHENNPSASDAELFALTEREIQERNERIKGVLLSEPGPYINAQGVLVDLMRKENEFLRVRVEFIKRQSAFASQIQALGLQMDLFTAQRRIETTLLSLGDRTLDLRKVCGKLDELGSIMDRGIDLGEDYRLSPQAVELARRDAVRSWDVAYGWVVWLGVAVRPRNPFRSYPPSAVNATIAEAIQGMESDMTAKKQRIKERKEKYCR